jgi:NAD+ synthase
MDWLSLDPEHEVSRIADRLRQMLARDLKRRGLVVGISGGIDSTVTAALGVQAVGKERVFGLLLPERHSDEKTLTLGREVADWLGIRYEVEDISRVLAALGFYRRYETAARQVIPTFDDSWQSKVVIHPVSGRRRFSFFSLVARSPSGETITARLSVQAYLEIVAATNFKQRTRKMIEYYHADRLNYAVAGTPNRLEFDQGFFVKNGDGSADVKPIAHLYKTQVYRLADHLRVPDEIRNRPPTTDTYSLPQTQEEFFFTVPYQQMDLCLYGKNHNVPLEEVAAASGLSVEQVRQVWSDIDRKRQTTRYLHLAPLLMDEIVL